MTLRRLGWVVLAAGLIWHLACLASLGSGALDGWFHDTSRDLGLDPAVDYGKGLDFFSIYQAGWNFRHGLSVYFGVRRSRFGPESTVVPYFSGFRYLPWYAVAYGSLLSLVQPWTSYWAWIICVELMLAACVVLTWRATRGAARPLLAGMWLLYSPYYVELYMGQQSMVTVLALLACMLALDRGRDAAADWAYGLSAVWKLNTLVALPLWVRRGRWRLLAGIAAFCLLTSAPYFLWVPGSWKEFSGYFHHHLLPDGPNAFGLPALVAVLWRRAELPPEMLRPGLKVMVRALVLLGGAATFARRRTDPVRLLCLWIASYFLVYRYAWEHHLVLLLPVFVMLHRRERAWWLLPAWLLAALPTPFGLLPGADQRFPQASWSALQEVSYHLQKVLPPLAVFSRMAGGELWGAWRERDLWVIHRLRSLRERWT